MRISALLRAYVAVSSLIFVCCVSSGCYRSDADIIGTWQGERDWKQLSTSSEEAAKALAAVNLEIKATGRFLLQDGGIPFEGNWVRETNSIRLDVDTFMNRNIEAQPDMVKESAIFSVRFENGSLYYKSKQDTVEIPMNRLPIKKV
jgi:hypothetical protein